MKKNTRKCERCNRIIKTVVIYFDDENIKEGQGINPDGCAHCFKDLYCCKRCYRKLENDYEKIREKCAKFNQDDPFPTEIEYIHDVIDKIHSIEHESVELV